jgi:hypothetical protein
MKRAEIKRFDTLYARHLKLLKLHGKSMKAIEAYSPAVRRFQSIFRCNEYLILAFFEPFRVSR